MLVENKKNYVIKSNEYYIVIFYKSSEGMMILVIKLELN
jgi:hypothetical protein